jgi:hypothetical protein
VLTITVEGRLAALKASTPINGFQRPPFPVVLAEANASGMVSNQNDRLSNSRKPPKITFG